MSPFLQFCESHPNFPHQPINSITSIPYIFLGLWILYQANPKRKIFRHIGIVSILVGVLSFAFHAWYNFPTEILDYTSDVLLALLLLVAFRQSHKTAKSKQVAFFVACLLIGYIFWLADFFKIWCGGAIINGHSIWHILTVLGIFILYRYINSVNE